MKSRYIKLPPELTDGENWTVSRANLDIAAALHCWLYTDGNPIGSKVTLEIIELTDEEVEALPSI